MMNNDFSNFTGYPREEIIGNSWTLYVAEDDVDRLFLYHKARREDPLAAPRNYEFKIRNKDGKLLHVFMTIAMIPGTTQSIASMVDITERVNTEKALRDSEERFRQLVESMNEGLGIQDRRGIITYVNDKVCKILQRPREEIIGKPSLDFISKRDLEAWMQNIDNKNAPDSYEVTWMTGGGEPIYTLVSPRAMYDSQGRFMGGFGLSPTSRPSRSWRRKSLIYRRGNARRSVMNFTTILGQHLIGIDVMTKVLRDRILPLSDDNSRYAGEINQLVKGAIEKTRRLARGLVPSILPLWVLRPHWKSLPPPHRHLRDLLRLSTVPRSMSPVKNNTLATHLYYIAKESIHNAIEHGKATKISIDLLNTGGVVSLSILDNGIGIKDVAGVVGIGLRIMNYRAG